jgi:hypothetical protein
VNIKTVLLINIFIVRAALCDFASLHQYYDIQQQYIFRDVSESGSAKVSEEFKRPYIVISLGENCYPAMHMRDYRLVEYSFPFDWIGTAFFSLQKLLINDFKGFLNKDHLEDKGEAFPGHLNVLENVYFTFHVHDFYSDKPLEEQYQDVQTRFVRRIERLYRALNSNKKVYLIRTRISKQEAQALVSLINFKFPQLNYTLIVGGNTAADKIDWKVPKVKNFYLENWYLYPNHKEWGTIFKEVGLIDNVATHTFNYAVNEKRV